MIKNPLYLVPFDFTSVAESALRLGLDLAIANDGCVVLLHVSKTKSDQIEARLRFKKKVKKAKKSIPNSTKKHKKAQKAQKSISKAKKA